MKTLENDKNTSDKIETKEYTLSDFLKYARRILPTAYLIGILGTLFYVLRGLFL